MGHIDRITAGLKNGGGDGAAQSRGEDLLTARDKEILAFAHGDDLASIFPAGRWRRLLSLVTGDISASRLANPRLEALRRFAVIARLAPHRLDEATADEALQLGYSAEQLVLVQELVAGAPRVRAPRR